jgi:hypothetical protein
MDITDLTGVYTYRSFRDNDDPAADVGRLLFGQGELTLFVRRDGAVSGTLAFPADAFADSKDFMDLAGSITSWSPVTIALTGKGRDRTGIADFEYHYQLRPTEPWPEGKDQKTVLVGTVLRAKDHGQPPNVATAGVTASVIAVKRTFVEARDVKDTGLLPEALEMLASQDHRLQHAVWHTLRAVWWLPAITDQDRQDIAAKGWDVKRPPRTRQGALDLSNGAGEDFLYMHREMIGMVRGIYQQAGRPMIAPWEDLPAPATPQVVYQGQPDPDDPAQVVFVRDGAASGAAVPNPSSDAERWVKSPEYFATVMQPLSQVFRQPRILASMSLGALGNLLETTIHNAMHQRWASVARNPRTGQPELRDDFDFGPDWNDPRYDHLGEFYSSHVNPVFWRLHGWIDRRIDDWFAAQEQAYPGRITQAPLAGVPWFAVNEPWVQVAAPLSGTGDMSRADSKHEHPHHHGSGGGGVQAMLDVMQIIQQAFARPAAQLLAPPATPARPIRLMSFATWMDQDPLAVLAALPGGAR